MIVYRDEDRIPTEYHNTINLRTALKAALDGLAVIQAYKVQEEDYDGSYIIWGSDGFKSVDFNQNQTIFDPNNAENKYYRLYQFMPSMMPATVWYSNIETTEIKSLTFKNILRQGHSKSMYNYIWAIGAYVDSNNVVYTVRVEKYYDSTCILNLFVETKGIFIEKQDAKDRVKEWVLEILEHQKKLGKRKKLKSVPKALKWIEKYPELFT